MRWRTRKSIAEHDWRVLFGDSLVLERKKVTRVSLSALVWRTVGRKGNVDFNSPAIMISASASKSWSPGAPLKKMFTSPIMGRVGMSLVASSPPAGLARMINVNSLISRIFRVPVNQIQAVNVLSSSSLHFAKHFKIAAVRLMMNITTTIVSDVPCISYSSSKDRGSLAVNSLKTWSCIHSWYLCSDNSECQTFR